ncbi:DUF2716 domain-containing protein [Catenulispora pinisilvae]|nr:DUF2716 domain-containing protein [Catenulispora pinisilvae]
MINGTVVELSYAEHRATWDRWYADFAFRPSTRQFPGIQEPTSSLTWSLDALNDDPGCIKLDQFTATVEQAIADCTPEGGSVLVLDWQHLCYRVRPDQGIEGEPFRWPLSPYPDGDYYIYLAEDFSFGSFGHPWEHTVCLFGTELLAQASRPVTTILGDPVRRDGHAATNP